MAIFNNLKISTRLVGAFTVLLALILLIGALSATRAIAVRDQLVDITERRMKIIAELELIRDEGNFQARALRNMALMTDPAQVAQEKQAIEKSKAEVIRRVAELDKIIVSAEGRALQQATADARQPFRDGQEKFMALLAGGQREEAIRFLLESLRPLQLAYFKAIDDAVTFQSKGADEAGAQAKTAVANLVTTIIAAVLLAALVAVGMAVWIIRSITRPINEAVELARAVAAGDLTRRVEVRSKDETGVLMQALAEMQNGLVQWSAACAGAPKASPAPACRLRRATRT